MDINQRVAARREEIARQEKEVAAERVAEQARAREAEAQQREAVAEAFGAEINAADEVEAVRSGETIDLVHVPDYDLFDPATKQALRVKLFHREARKLWTPLDQWVIISLIAGGICLIHAAGFGLLLILIGLLRRRPSTSAAARSYVKNTLNCSRPCPRTDPTHRNPSRASGAIRGPFFFAYKGTNHDHHQQRGRPIPRRRHHP